MVSQDGRAIDLLRQRLRAAGLGEIRDVTVATGGTQAVAAVVGLADGTSVFVKTMVEPVPTLFEIEAEGLSALRELGRARVPDVLGVRPDLLVLERLRPRPDGARFWERLAHQVAVLHTTATSDRFGWHRDGWLGRLPQQNSWDADGHRFFAEHRLLSWLRYPLAEAAFNAADRRALERLCERLPELVPVRPAALTHGDLWPGNLCADPAGEPTLIDPAVSYAWPDNDLSMLWHAPRPPESDRFFAVYAELTGLDAGWRDRTAVLNLRELLCEIAHGDGDWGAADAVRQVIAPFRAHAAAHPTPSAG